MSSTNHPESPKHGRWVYRPWITVGGRRIYPKPPKRAFRWWEEGEDDNQA